MYVQRPRLVVGLVALLLAAACLGVLMNGGGVTAGSKVASPGAKEMAQINACIARFTESTQLTLHEPVLARDPRSQRKALPALRSGPRGDDDQGVRRSVPRPP